MKQPHLIDALKLLTGLLFLVLAQAANATVISNLSERDWLTTGDGSVTFDASTGLEWLDLTVTEGIGIPNTTIEGGVVIIRGGEIVLGGGVVAFGDFRYARLAEIEDLLDAAIVGTGARDSLDLSDRAAAETLVSLLGATAITPEFTRAIGVVAPNGIEGPSLNRLAFIGYTPQSLFSEVSDPFGDATFIQSSGNPGIGHWLVRSAAAPESVPEPPLIALIALGLIGIAFSRRRKAKG